MNPTTISFNGSDRYYWDLVFTWCAICNSSMDHLGGCPESDWSEMT